MKSKFKYILAIFTIVILVANHSNAQDATVGSWVVSSSYGNEITGNGEIEKGYMNYRMFFSYIGNPIIELLNSEESFSSHYHFAFTVGNYSECSGNLNLYLTDNYYYNTEQDTLNIYDEIILPEATLLKKDNTIDYQLLYSAELNASGNFWFYFVNIVEDGNTLTSSINSFPLDMPEGISNLAFTISNVVDDEQYVFTVCGTPNNSYTNTLGLEKYEIAEDDFEFDATLVLDNQNSGFGKYNFAGFDLEMQDKNEVDDPIIAWITTPIRSTENDTIFIYDPIYASDNYLLDLGNLGTNGSGHIGGIEFSPFVGEENMMFVSTENLGLIKINWQTGTLVHQYTPTLIDFSHTSVQTAPNGKVYAVSDDGKRFGELGPNNSFNPSVFIYPVNIPTAPSSHNTYKVYDPDGDNIKYFSLPDNDQPIYPSFQELLVIDNQASQNIASLSDMTWDANDGFPNNTLMFEHGFILTDNVTLTVNDMTLEFNQLNDAKVIIEPGSKLIINGSVLTKHHCYEDAKWAGVEVWGNKKATQTEANQGKLVMNNSTIEHAHEAVQLYNPDSLNTSGGIITATNSTFKNNHRAVSFMSYKNAPFGLERNYDASFRYCNFINDVDYINDNPFLAFITMWKVRGVQFTACDFINSSDFPNSKAIYTLDAGYKLKGYCTGNTGPNGCTGDWITNTFTNFEKAIESANTPETEQYSINIWDSDFENNQWGIYMTTVNNAATMLYNNFQLGNSGNNFEKTRCGYFSTRGIQMNESFGFNIEENEFDKMQGNIDTDLVGVLVNKCPSDLDDIYLNQFNNLTAGNQADSVNRVDSEDDATGVSYFCNENSGNVHDFYITANQSMIRGDVGSLYLASGNKLSNTAVIFRNDYTQYVNYYYWAGDPNQILPDLDPNDYVIPDSVPFPNECLSNYGNNGGGIGIDPKVILSTQEKQEVEQEFYSNYQAYEAVNDLLIELKDGGSTEITNLSIATAQPGDTWELRSNLLGMSPYLSKAVLKEAADRTDVLPESVLFEILSANPEELRKQDLMQHLETKDQPLPDYMLSILRQISNGSSAKTALLSQKAQHFAAKTKAAQKMIISIKNEEELDIVALRNWLGNLESLETDKQIVATYLYQDDYANANALLEMIPDLYDLQGEKLDEFNDYVDLLDIQIGLKQQNRNIFMLTEPEKSQLLDLAENSTGDARSGARSILSFVYGNQYCDCITPIEGGNKSSYSSYVYSNEDMAKALGFSISLKPNPAIVHTSVDYILPLSVEQAELQLINAEGKIVWTSKVSGVQGQITIDIRSFKSGAYIFRLLSEEYSISESLIIN